MTPGEMPRYDFRFNSLADFVDAHREAACGLEVVNFVENLEVRHDRPHRPNQGNLRRVPRQRSPGAIHMLNLVRLRDRAAYPDGREATGAEAYAAYGRESGPVFQRLGGEIVWRGAFELMLIGPAEERWDHLLHRAISKRRRLRRNDPRSRLSRGGQTSSGGGRGFAADQARAERGGRGIWLRS